MGETKKNILYNLIYQLLITLQPLILAPYLSRVLGAENIGVYSYTFTIVNFFVLFSRLGVKSFGNRSISQERDDEKKLSSQFANIYAMQFIIGILVLIAFAFVMLITSTTVIMWIQALLIVASIFDISWFFFGIEEFKLTVIRNALVKILTLSSILIFVNNKNDLWIYTFIMAISSVISNLMLWPFLKKNVHFIRPELTQILKMIKPNLVLFIPVIFISFYTQLNRVFLGIFSTMEEVAFFSNAMKITVLPLTFLTAFSTVMLPKMSNMFANSLQDQIKNYIEKSIRAVMFFACASAFGLAAIAHHFAPLFFGQGFERTGAVIFILSPSIIFMAWANVIRTQYLIPFLKDRLYIISIISATIASLSFNIIAIPRFGAVGAALGVITAEFVVAFIQTWSIRKELPIANYIKNSFFFMIAGIVMFLGLKIFSFHISLETWWWLGVKILIGAVIYIFCTFIYFTKIKRENLRYILNI